MSDVGQSEQVENTHTTHRDTIDDDKPRPEAAMPNADDVTCRRQSRVLLEQVQCDAGSA